MTVLVIGGTISASEQWLDAEGSIHGPHVAMALTQLAIKRVLQRSREDRTSVE